MTKEFFSSDFDTFEIEILELKKVKYNDLEDMVYRMDLTNDESIDILDKKIFSIKKYELYPAAWKTLKK